VATKLKLRKSKPFFSIPNKIDKNRCFYTVTLQSITSNKMYRSTLRRVLRKGASALRNQKATVTQANPLQKPNTNKQQNKTAFSFEKNLYQNSVNSFNQ
jgi:hypothetical protein